MTPYLLKNEVGIVAGVQEYLKDLFIVPGLVRVILFCESLGDALRFSMHMARHQRKFVID